jgi:hypothetical protein
MIRTTPDLRTAAERLLRATASKRGAAKLSTAARVSDRLRRVLSTLLGAAGFRALLARAVTLGKAEAPGLSGVVVEADGSLSTVDHALSKDPFSDDDIVLVAHILGLLVTFVGAALMLRLVNDAWPKTNLDDLDFDKG